MMKSDLERSKSAKIFINMNYLEWSFLASGLSRDQRFKAHMADTLIVKSPWDLLLRARGGGGRHPTQKDYALVESETHDRNMWVLVAHESEIYKLSIPCITVSDFFWGGGWGVADGGRLKWTHSVPCNVPQPAPLEWLPKVIQGTCSLLPQV